MGGLAQLLGANAAGSAGRLAATGAAAADWGEEETVHCDSYPQAHMSVEVEEVRHEESEVDVLQQATHSACE